MLNHRDCALASAFISPSHVPSSINSYSALIKSETFKAGGGFLAKFQSASLNIIITITDLQLLRLNVLITIGQILINSIFINHHPLRTNSLKLYLTTHYINTLLQRCIIIIIFIITGFVLPLLQINHSLNNDH